MRGEFAEWERRAICKQIGTKAFYAEKANEYSRARAVCGMCSVKAQCLERALTDGEKHGMWGGLTAPERLALLRKRHGDSYVWPKDDWL